MNPNEMLIDTNGIRKYYLITPNPWNRVIHRLEKGIQGKGVFVDHGIHQHHVFIA